MPNKASSTLLTDMARNIILFWSHRLSLCMQALWIELCAHTHKNMMKSYSPVPKNVTLFGNKVIADVTS